MVMLLEAFLTEMPRGPSAPMQAVIDYAKNKGDGMKMRELYDVFQKAGGQSGFTSFHTLVGRMMSYDDRPGMETSAKRPFAFSSVGTKGRGGESVLRWALDPNKEPIVPQQNSSPATTPAKTAPKPSSPDDDEDGDEDDSDDDSSHSLSSRDDDDEEGGTDDALEDALGERWEQMLDRWDGIASSRKGGEALKMIGAEIQKKVPKHLQFDALMVAVKFLIDS